MIINTDNLISITELNQDFAKLARLVDKNGAAVVLKNNIPRYVILDYNQLKEANLETGIEHKTKFSAETASPDDVLAAARKILKEHFPAFKELAK
jgi:antitoxin Phd